VLILADLLRRNNRSTDILAIQTVGRGLKKERGGRMAPELLGGSILKKTSGGNPLDGSIFTGQKDGCSTLRRSEAHGRIGRHPRKEGGS
jgi:hypothetical protein